MAEVGLASVGLGWWGGVLARAAAASGRARVVTCFARSEEARAAFAAEHGCRAAASYEDVLADPEVDGVLLATPHSTHEELITAAAAAGKHVFVEKPLTLTVEEGRRAVAAAERAGVVLQVGHHRRKSPATQELRRRAAAGELGRLHLLHGHMTKPVDVEPRQGWRGDPAEAPLGGMTSLGIHVVENLQALAGPARRVAAMSHQLREAGTLDDATGLLLEFDGGAVGHVATSMLLADVCTTAAHGTEGSAWSEDDGATLYVQARGEAERRPVAVDDADPVVAQLEEFAACVAEGGRPEVSGREALEVVAVLEAGVRSVASGEVVDVARVREAAS